MLFIYQRPNFARLSALLFVVVAMLCSISTATAQETQTGEKPVFSTQTGGPLSDFRTDPGKLFGTVERSNGLRINRDKKLFPETNYQMDATPFSQPPVEMQPPPQQPPFSAFAREQAPAPKKSNYVWNLSRDGGYYECTGQVRVVVPGDQLYKYGGTFIDGTPVPDTPVATNFANHAYRFPYVIKRNPGN